MLVHLSVSLGSCVIRSASYFVLFSGMCAVRGVAKPFLVAGGDAGVSADAGVLTGGRRDHALAAARAEGAAAQHQRG